jgi:hypothetical protein
LAVHDFLQETALSINFQTLPIFYSKILSLPLFSPKKNWKRCHISHPPYDLPCKPGKKEDGKIRTDASELLIRDMKQKILDL